MPPKACLVAGCRYAHSHLTCAHRCGTCGARGHGQLECGNTQSIDDLNNRANAGPPTVATPCDVDGCADPHTHCADAHHCDTCQRRGRGCACSVARHVECPLCKTVNIANPARRVFSNASCCVCFGDGAPLVLFDTCMHACVCAACLQRLP